MPAAKAPQTAPKGIPAQARAAQQPKAPDMQAAKAILDAAADKAGREFFSEGDAGSSLDDYCRGVLCLAVRRAPKVRHGWQNF
jgi:hypothetical protein